MALSDDSHRKEIEEDEAVSRITVYARHDGYAEPIEFYVAAVIAEAIQSGDRDWIWALIACIEDEAAAS